MMEIIKNKEEVKSVMNIIQAFANGKTIQAIDPYEDERVDQAALNFKALFEGQYRIKPEHTYRQFKDAEECWNEMMKHQPFGWVKDKKDGHHALITAVDDDTCGMSLNGNAEWSLSGIMDLFTFADGVPFGVKIEDDYNGIK